MRRLLYLISLFSPITVLCQSAPNTPFSKAEFHFNNGNCDSSIYYFRIAIKEAQREKDNRGDFLAHYRLCFNYSLCDFQIDSAYLHANIVENKALEIGDSEFIAYSHNAFGALHYKIKAYQEAEKRFKQVIKSAEKISNDSIRITLLGKGYMNLIETQFYILEDTSKYDEISKNLIFVKDSILPIVTQKKYDVSNFVAISWMNFQGLLMCIKDSTKEKGEDLIFDAIDLANENIHTSAIEDIYFIAVNA